MARKRPHFGRILLGYRDASGMTCVGLAIASGLSDRTIRDAEDCPRGPATTRVLDLMLKGLKVPLRQYSEDCAAAWNKEAK